MSTKEHIDGGGQCLHAPSVIAMGKEAFIAFYMDKVDYVAEDKRLKYLTDQYDRCVELMNPPKHKSAPVDQQEPEVTEPEPDKPVKPTRNSTSKKSTEKKE